MSVSLDTVASAESGAASATISTGSFTVASNSNMALLAMVINGNTLTVSTVSGGGGGTWVQAGQFLNGARIQEAWYSLNPTSGSQNVNVTLSGNIGANGAVLGVFSLFGVDVSGTPFTNYTTVAGTGVTLTVSCNANGMAFASIFGTNTNIHPPVGCTVTDDVALASFFGGYMGHCTGSPTSVFTWQNTGNARGIQGLSANASAAGGVSQPTLVYGDLNGIGSPGRFFKDIT